MIAKFNTPRARAQTKVKMRSPDLPHGWRYVALSSLSRKLITYGIVQPGPHVPSGVPFIQTKDLTSGVLDPREMDRTSHTIHAAYTRSAVTCGDIIVGIRASVGRIGYVSSELRDANISRGVARVSPQSDIQGRFLFFALQSSNVQSNIVKEVKGSTYAEITLPALRNIEVPVPPTLVEQKAIAEALGDADALIESLEQLIAKKRHLKQAAMEQLLTGKTRLPGFSAEWHTQALGKGTCLVSGHHVLARYCNTTGEGVPYLTGPADFPKGKIVLTKYTTKPGTLCEFGDVLVTVKGSGAGAMVIADARYCISRQLMALRIRDWNARFIYYSLLQNSVKLHETSTGLIPGLSRSDILGQNLPLPIDREEQLQIASVLSDMDAEIAALEQRRDKTKEIKQGMMQQLLTGRIRLVQPEHAA